ncbi:MAG TPA: glycine betaine ABC transporter substrate-binding protein [Bryobacteraceae bacterium]
MTKRQYARVGGVSCLCLAAFLVCGCAEPPKPLIIGSGNSAEQMVVGEIVAQHLEHRLHRKIDRRLGMGDELILYEAIVSGNVTLYPDYAAALETAILKETPDLDPAIVRERVRNELERRAQLILLEPLGYESTPVVVVKSAVAKKDNLKTLSDAAHGTLRWKVGISYDFEQRGNGLTALKAYGLPMDRGARAMEPAQLFPALEEDQVNMLASYATDGHLVSPKFAVLADDRGVFAPYQAALLVRADALTGNPDLRPVLSDLSGKLSTEKVRALAAEVELKHRQPAEVASAFLTESGL